MTDSASATRAAVRQLGVADDVYGTTLNTHVSPAATETVGQALANALGRPRPDRIAVWNTSDDAVLAHAVARAAGLTVVRVADETGVASVDPALVPGERVALLATAWEARRLNALITLVRATGAEVSAVLAVLDTPALRQGLSVPVLCLLPALDAATKGSL
ncbi:hypothetical protein AB0P36_31490 [Streptomyces flavidovirens]|uniref:hypothetical protein n=1 Tax=Streptomyces flavidovirens TaxID=67298 RepID=UPI003446E5D8